MTAYNHDVAMAGHAKRQALVAVTDKTGTVQYGTLLYWRPRNKYKARVHIVDHVAPYTFPLARYHVEVVA